MRQIVKGIPQDYCLSSLNKPRNIENSDPMTVFFYPPPPLKNVKILFLAYLFSKIIFWNKLLEVVEYQTGLAATMNTFLKQTAFLNAKNTHNYHL